MERFRPPRPPNNILAIYIMSLKSGNYKGFVYDVANSFSSIAISVSDVSGVVASVKTEFQDLSAQVQDLLPVYYSQGSSTIEMTSTRVDYTDDDFILELPAGTYNFNANLRFSLPGAGYWNDPTVNANLEGLQFNLNTGNLSYLGVPAARTDSVSSIETNVSGRFVLTENTFVKPRFYADGGASPLPITVTARAWLVTIVRY